MCVVCVFVCLCVSVYVCLCVACVCLCVACVSVCLSVCSVCVCVLCVCLCLCAYVCLCEGASSDFQALLISDQLITICYELSVLLCTYFVTVTCLPCHYVTQVCRAIHRLIADYRDQRRGPSLVLLQSPWGGGGLSLCMLYSHSLFSAAVKKLSQLIPSLEDFPQVIIPSLERYRCHYFHGNPLYPIATTNTQHWTGKEWHPAR